MSLYHGMIVAINTDGAVEAKALDTPQVLPDLNRICQGHIESIPGFHTYVHEGVSHACVAFCNTDGKLRDLPYNAAANALWLAQFNPRGDRLVGNIAVVFGNPAFMRKL